MLSIGLSYFLKNYNPFVNRRW